MKKVYKTPVLEIERYKLDANIASNCGMVVNMGPQTEEHPDFCDKYYEITGDPIPSMYSLSKPVYNIEFWEELGCDCYVTAGGVFFTSQLRGK